MASSLKSKSIYDVFLSFRGADVRTSFLSHLYQALDQNGIYTFRDSEELRKGDQISATLMKAIEESCIAIIIFSEDYASSWWCLEEMAKIMECKEQKDLTVLPVFYKVDPREVREGRESYRKALDKHEDKFRKDMEKVKKWKKALFDAGNLSGWHLNDEDESKLILQIVKEISTHLNLTPLYVTKHLVGIESPVVKLKEMLNLASDNDVVMVGLWGQGGIGKTTLAKVLYNSMFRQFDGSCFLENVREASKDSKDLVPLQNELLSNVLSLQNGLVVTNANRGINIIQHRLRHKKVLLVLDDVDDLHQLHALAGEGKCFGNGSRIIVTTRDKHLLTCYGIDQDHVYEVKPLSYHEARELLSNHAFLTRQKLKIKTNLVDSVLNHAGGLPLALEVLGSCLCGKREDVWESTLEKVSRIPNKTINDVLKISYDGLEENEQEIFLDIACFFKRNGSEYVKKVLDSCDVQTTVGFDILIERSLISIDYGILKMHDLIQSMGMDIVRQECRDDPRSRSRLWQYDDVADALSSDVGDCAVKAIVLEPPQLKELSIHPNAFPKMRKLRLLILRNVHISFHGPIYLPNGLRWMEFAGSGPWIPKFPTGQKKLVSIDMSEGSITEVVKHFKDFEHLTYIKLRDCESLNSPCTIYLPKGEMPKWFQPVEDSSISFVASKDLYDKFLGLIFCAVPNNKGDHCELNFSAYFNGKNEGTYRPFYCIWDSCGILITYFAPSHLWKAVHFDQIDGSYAQFSITLEGFTSDGFTQDGMEKWGFRIISKQLDDNLKDAIRDHKLIDPAFFYEVGHDSTDLEAQSSHIYEDNPTEIGLSRNLQESSCMLENRLIEFDLDCPPSSYVLGEAFDIGFREFPFPGYFFPGDPRSRNKKYKLWLKE
ncbi:disease resistance protein RPV1 isoform X2 [Eucalyptus grandis]|uniref:disease resistance protein RPV1 isoform X2 n=1 Tax=Eucalyptus grandis TaxID=71139 RepID=UPI00192F0C40|nr:disease resistance protein RPV1 isoform X2 [Eucalyptus grandis]